MKNNYLFLILVIIFRFFTSVILGTIMGIWAELLSLACTLVLLLLLSKNKPLSAAVHSPSLKENLFSALTFSGVLLTALPLRFAVGCMIPELTLRTGYFERFEGADAVVYGVAFILSCALAVSAVITALIYTDGYSTPVRVVVSGLLLSVLSLSLGAVLADFFVGCFVAGFILRYKSMPTVFLYTAIYKCSWIAVEFFEFNAQTTYGGMMGAVQIAGMLCLFASVLVLGVYSEWRFTYYKKSAPVIAVASVCSAVLLAVIGCAIIQYSNI